MQNLVGFKITTGQTIKKYFVLSNTNIILVFIFNSPGSEELIVTPFAQILASLKTIRNNYIQLASPNLVQ